MSIPLDAHLADEHFVVQCRHAVTVQVLDEQNCLIVNGDPTRRLEVTVANERPVRFTAGQTEFDLLWTPCSSEEARPAVTHAESADDTKDPVDASPLIASIAGKMSLSERATALIEPPLELSKYATCLLESELHDDAVKYIAAILPARESVRWALSIESVAAIDAGSLTESIGRWVVNGDESDRRTVQRMLDDSAHGDRLKWIASAVAYSGGSLAPDDQPVVSPPAHLTAIAIVTSIRWAMSKESDPEAARRSWIASGIESIQAIERKDR